MLVELRMSTNVFQIFKYNFTEEGTELSMCSDEREATENGYAVRPSSTTSPSPLLEEKSQSVQKP